MKQKTGQDAYLTLAALCAQGEHCQWEIQEKMRRWELDEATQATVMARLVKEHYVDDERYARAFVKDKIRYNKWGCRKVEQALWQKHINEDIRRRVLDDVEDEEYLNVLRPLLKQKKRSTKAKDNYELNHKLLRFALSRGFTYELIRQCIDVNDIDENADE